VIPVHRALLRGLVERADSVYGATVAVTPTALAEHAGLGLTSIEGALDELESQEFVVALRTPRQGAVMRSVYLVTDSGRNALQADSAAL
jgi:DNA-binding PadR family transcriptional regulator